MKTTKDKLDTHRQNSPFCAKCGHPDGHCNFDDQGNLVKDKQQKNEKVIMCKECHENPAEDDTNGLCHSCYTTSLL